MLPPSRTKIKRHNGTINVAGRGRNTAYRLGYVYATTDRKFAELWAAAYVDEDGNQGSGLVYEVELVNPEPDPDLQQGDFSFQAREGTFLSPGQPVLTDRGELRSMRDEILANADIINAQRKAEDAAKRALAKAEREALQAGKRERRAARKKT